MAGGYTACQPARKTLQAGACVRWKKIVLRTLFFLFLFVVYSVQFRQITYF